MKTFSGFLFMAILFVAPACGKNEAPAIVTKADFSISGYEIPAPSIITFINTSRNASSYLWDFGDGTGSALFNPTHTYNLDGTYLLKLRVTGTSGVDSICKLVSIEASLPSNKSGFSYFFSRCSGTPLGALFKTVNPLSTSVKWDFGNGNINIERDPIVQILLPADYTVKYSSQINGVRDTVIRIIRIQ